MGYNNNSNNLKAASFRCLVTDRDDDKLFGFEQEQKSRLKRKLRSFDSCGNKINIKGQLRTHLCRNPFCRVCSKIWAKKQADRLYQKCGGDDTSNYRMVTCIIDATDDINSTFDLFKRFKKKVANEIDRLRRKKKNNNNQQHEKIGLAGSLEIDMFYMDQFYELGDKKQESYINNFHFKMNEFQDAVWVVTFHGVIFSPEISDGEITAIFKKGAPEVHLKELNQNQSIDEASHNIIGYSVKTNLSTTYEENYERLWEQKDIEDYMEFVCSMSRGRQKFKFFIGPSVSRSKRR